MERFEDGLGQSMPTDILWLFRFRACRSRVVGWRLPTASDTDLWEADARLRRLGDGLVAAADVDGRTWLVIERFWHGWPDPPEFAFVGLNPDGRVWAAADFSDWPRRWAKPEDKS